MAFLLIAPRGGYSLHGFVALRQTRLSLGSRIVCGPHPQMRSLLLPGLEERWPVHLDIEEPDMQLARARRIGLDVGPYGTRPEDRAILATVEMGVDLVDRCIGEGATR
jgi:hypothetical protein